MGFVFFSILGSAGCRQLGTTRRLPWTLPGFSARAAWTGLALFLLAFHVRVMLFERLEVRGESMQPSLRNRETVWVDKVRTGVELPDLSFPFGPLTRTGKLPRMGLAGVRRGDIVVFRYPGHAPLGEYFVKRVIALPGDQYAIADGKISVNGMVIAEPYLTAGMKTEPRIEDSGAGLIGMPDELSLLAAEVRYSTINGAEPQGVVPEHTIYVLGDNRAISKDSRSLGFVPTFYLLGIVLGR